MLQSYVMDSATSLEEKHKGAVVVAGSHGGEYVGYLAARANVTALIVNDAGVGKDDAGIASLAYLQALGVCAATASHLSARIGDGQDMWLNGKLSHVNSAADKAGCRAGMSVQEAVALLRQHATEQTITVPSAREARMVLASHDSLPVIGMDSVSLLLPEDAGALVVAASHGNVLAQSRSDGVQAPVAAIAFHDAGIGKDEAGFGRLPALQQRGIAALTVSADSARIGDARSCYQDGIISRANACAQALGAVVGRPLRECYAAWQADQNFVLKTQRSEV